MNILPALSFLAIMASAVFAQYKVINNPYESVNWDTYGRYKAALHVHSTYSDGSNTMKEMLIDHYNKDYSIVVMTDHGIFTEDWDKEPQKAASDESTSSYNSSNKVHLTESEKAQINSGEYDHKGRTLSNGMIGLNWGNEPFAMRGYEIDIGHSFTAGAKFTYSAKESITDVLKKSAAAGAINYIHHPGRYTGGVKGGIDGEKASNDPEKIGKYVKMLKETEALGMEIINKLDNESRSDRILYDNVLKALAPEERLVWAFSSDDSHSTDAVGYSFDVMFLPKLTSDATKEAMKKGAFYAVSRVDRREGINDVSATDGNASTKSLLSQPVPSISKIQVDKEKGIITITGDDYNTIEWIADGVKIATGNTLNMNKSEYEGKIGRYVRAQLKSKTGIAFTQPFYVLKQNIPKIDPDYVIIPTGLSAIKGNKLSSIKLDAGWAWANGNQIIEEGTQTYPAIFTPNDLTIYNVITVDLEVIGKSANENPAPLTNIVSAILKPAIYTYNGSEQKPVLMLDNIELVEGVDYTATYTNNKDAGIDDAEINITGIGKYTGNLRFTFTINKANQLDLNINNVPSKKFGDADFNLSTTGGTVTDAATYELVSGPGTVTNGGKVSITGAGNIVVRATKAGSNNYNPVSAEITINVAKASLTLKADNKTISINDPEPTYTYTVLGLIGADTKESIITTQPTISMTNTNINISGGATTSPNYTIAAYEKGTLTIKDKAIVTISGLSAKNSTFNGAPNTGYTGTPTFTGGTPTTALTANYTGQSGTVYNSTAIAPTNAGSYTVKLTLDNDPMYKGEISINFTISKASLTLKADDKTIAVGDPAPTYTYAVSGLIVPDTKESIITTQPTLSVTSFSSSTAKTFDITISGGATTSPNYAIGTLTKGTLTVANKTTVTIDGLYAQSGPYNGKPRIGYAGTPTFKNGTASVTPTNPALTATYIGQDGTTYSSTSTAPTNAGNYKVTLSLANDPLYKGTATSINFAINKVSLTLKADDKTILVGAPAPTYTYSVSELVSPDTKESIITTMPTLSVANFSSSAAKNFDIIISGGATSNPNYTIATRANGTLSVNEPTSLPGESSPIRLPQVASSNHIMQIKNGINLTATGKAVVEIYRLNGSLIQRQNFKNGVYSISLSHLPKGIYIAKASFGHETKILRVVVR